MSYIKGKFTKILYQNEDTNYVVALFRLQETDEEEFKEKIKKTINVNGIIVDVRLNYNYTLRGEYVVHPKYGEQFSFTSYEREVPTSEEDIQNFLASSFVDGCGEALAKKIVAEYHENSLVKIKEDINNLLAIKGVTLIKAMKIQESIFNFEKNDTIIAKLKEIGFSLEDASRILSKHEDDLDAILEGNLYLLKDLSQDYKYI